MAKVSAIFRSRIERERALPHRYRVLLAGGGVLLLGAVLFYRLGQPPILLWDEGRLAVNALEMTQNGAWVVTHYDGAPDTWNTKPPLAIWLMAASMEVFGYEEVAVRLPSALSGLAALLLVFAVCAGFLRDPLAGLAAALVLASSAGFIGEHVARTGDYDALLALWITAYSLSFFLYIQARTGRMRRRYLVLTAVTFGLAFLTKSVAALLGLPALLGYAVMKRRMGQITRSPSLYLATVLVLGGVASYYVVRDLHQPGYLAAVIADEWLKPYVETVHEHTAPPWYYVRDLLDFKYVPWAYAFPFLAVAAVWSSRPRHRALARYSLLVASVYALVISFSQTKLPWYDAPFYPVAALVAGIGAVEVGRAVLRHRLVVGSSMRRSVSVMALSGLMFVAYLFVAYRVVYRHHGLLYPWSRANPQLASGLYLERVTQARPDLQRFTFIDERYDAFNGHLLYYASVARMEGRSVGLVTSDRLVGPGEVVATCDVAVQERLTRRFAHAVLDATARCVTLEVREAVP